MTEATTTLDREAPEMDDTPVPGRVLPGLSLVVVAAVVVLAGVVMSLVGSVTTGLSVDDPRHATRLNSYFANGLYVTKAEARATAFGIPGEAFVYGPVTALIQHGANKLMGNEPRRHAERTPAAYTTRHVVVALLSILGLLATGLAAALMLGHWRWGVVAAGALAAVPLWTGHAMFNGKDSTVATGHALATLGVVMLASFRSRSWRWQVLSAVPLAMGTILMLGTRPGMWTSLAASVTLLLAVLWWSRELAWRTSVALFGSLIFSYFWLGVAYPRVYKLPFEMLWHSALGSAEYEHLKHPNGRAYLTIHLIQEWPLILLGLMLLGALAALIRALSLIKVRSADATALLVVGSQAATLPILGTLLGSAFYQGIRQVLFAVPAQAILATFGLATILAVAQQGRTRRVWAAVAGLGLLLPMATQATLFPYQYTYQNVAADVVGSPIDADYLGTSYRAQMQYLPRDIKVVCPQFANALARNIGDCRTRPRGQLSTYWRASGQGAVDAPNGREYYAIWRGAWKIPPFCRTTHELVRHRNLQRVVISRVLLCHPPATAENTPPYNPWEHPENQPWTGGDAKTRPNPKNSRSPVRALGEGGNR